MYRQSPGRSSQRSKKIKVKHVLQLSLVLGVCCWLLYQVKHSHDKNVELEKTEAEGIPERFIGKELSILGRKGIQDRSEETVPKNVKYGESANEEEETETKSERVVRTEDEGEEREVDEPEENDQEGTDADYEELPVDEKETEVEDEIDVEAALNGTGIRSSVDETDQDGESMSFSEAREKHYKADDASSAVGHYSQTTSIENVDGHSELQIHLENRIDNNISSESDKSGTRKDLEVAVDELAEEHQRNMTSDSENGIILENSTSNITTIEGSTEIAVENHNVSLNNSKLGNSAEVFLSELKSENESSLSTVTPNQRIGVNSTDSSGKARVYDLNSMNPELLPIKTVSEDMAKIEASSETVESTPNGEVEELLREAIDTLPDIPNEGAAAE